MLGPRTFYKTLSNDCLFLYSRLYFDPANMHKQTAPFRKKVIKNSFYCSVYYITANFKRSTDINPAL